MARPTMSARPRLLDLFCCEGGAAMGYHRAGFDVVGVDIAPQPRYPFEFHQADALDYLEKHGHEYDAIHASPPCQAHSRARYSWGREYETRGLLGDTLAALAVFAEPSPWVIENVDSARMIGALVLCGTSFGLGLHRHRRFETSFPMLAPPCNPSAIRYRGREAEVFGHHGNTQRIRDEWAVPWMSQYGIAQSIPPAMTEYVGEQLIAHLAERAA